GWVRRGGAGRVLNGRGKASSDISPPRPERSREWLTVSLVECDRWPHGSGSDLINVYLSESRVEEAWRAARRFGAGSGGRGRAEASAALRPREAAELYRPEIEARLVHANTAAYPEVARLLADRQRLSAPAGEAGGFAGD